jgi:hypothetical protein
VYDGCHSGQLPVLVHTMFTHIKARASHASRGRNMSSPDVLLCAVFRIGHFGKGVLKPVNEGNPMLALWRAVAVRCRDSSCPKELDTLLQVMMAAAASENRRKLCSRKPDGPVRRRDSVLRQCIANRSKPAEQENQSKTMPDESSLRWRKDGFYFQNEFRYLSLSLYEPARIQCRRLCWDAGRI